MDAIAKLGGIYNFGWGGPKDGTKALAYYRRAANAGNAKAQDYLSWLLLYGKDAGGRAIQKNTKEAEKWIRLAAKQGNASAQLKESSAYFLGRGEPKNKDEGLRWLKRAANQKVCDIDVANARYILGILYLHGHVGVSGQQVKAILNSSDALH